MLSVQLSASFALSCSFLITLFSVLLASLFIFVCSLADLESFSLWFCPSGVETVGWGTTFEAVCWFGINHGSLMGTFGMLSKLISCISVGLLFLTVPWL